MKMVLLLRQIIFISFFSAIFLVFQPLSAAENHQEEKFLTIAKALEILGLQDEPKGSLRMVDVKAQVELLLENYTTELPLDEVGSQRKTVTGNLIDLAKINDWAMNRLIRIKTAYSFLKILPPEILATIGSGPPYQGDDNQELSLVRTWKAFHLHVDFLSFYNGWSSQINVLYQIELRESYLKYVETPYDFIVLLSQPVNIGYRDAPVYKNLNFALDDFAEDHLDYFFQFGKVNPPFVQDFLAKISSPRLTLKILRRALREVQSAQEFIEMVSVPNTWSPYSEFEQEWIPFSLTDEFRQRLAEFVVENIAIFRKFDPTWFQWWKLYRSMGMIKFPVSLLKAQAAGCLGILRR